MVAIKYAGDELWQRIEDAVESVRHRMPRIAAALDEASIAYAVVGGNAVQQWVIQVDPGAVRNTRDVDIVLNRTDLESAKSALETAGFHYRHTAGVSMFLDGSEARASDVVFVGKKVSRNYVLLDVVERIDGIATMPFERLVQMKLTSFGRKVRVHLLDMMTVGLIDESWRETIDDDLLRSRLQELLDDPEG